MMSLWDALRMNMMISYQELVRTFLKALGGKENIKSLDNCVTRLRLTIADMGLIDEAAIKRAGGIAVVKLDQNTLQVIIGTKVIALRRDMDNYMGIC